MKIFLPLLLILFLISVSWTESQVSLSISTDTARIGDRIDIKIIAKTSDRIDDITLETGKNNFEIISQKKITRNKFKDYQMFEINLAVSFFSTGQYTLGPFTINLMRNRNIVESKKTNSVDITIQSVLTDKDKDIKNLKDVIPLKGNPYHFLKTTFIILAILALGLLLFWVMKKRKQNRKRDPAVRLSPLEELEADFRKLLEKKYVEKGDIKPFFIQLTDIFKHYLFRAYGFNAQDLTSSETISYLKRKENRDPIHRNADHLLNTSDLVKFAKFIPRQTQIKQVEQNVRDIISIEKQKIIEENKTENVPISK